MLILVSKISKLHWIKHFIVSNLLIHLQALILMSYFFFNPKETNDHSMHTHQY